MITQDIAEKVLKTVDAGLVSGLGEPVPGKMCVEAAVCYAMGLPHSDEPSCVSPAIRRLKIRLNDSGWSSDVARAAGMRRLALIQLGSADAVDDKEFARRVAELAIKTCVPTALRAAASIQKDQAHVKALMGAAKRCEKNPTRQNATQAIAVADAAARAAYAAHAAHAADAAYAAAAKKSRNDVLGDFAEGVVQILIEMKAPGAQWLYLTEGKNEMELRDRISSQKKQKLSGLH